MLPAGQSNSFRIYHHKQTLRQTPRNHKQSKQSLRKDPEITSKRGLLVSLTSWEYVTRPVVLSSLGTQQSIRTSPQKSQATADCLCTQGHISGISGSVRGKFGTIGGQDGRLLVNARLRRCWRWAPSVGSSVVPPAAPRPLCAAARASPIAARWPDTPRLPRAAHLGRAARAARHTALPALHPQRLAERA